MSKLQEQQSQESSKAPSESFKGPERIAITQDTTLHDLLRVLNIIVDQNGLLKGGGENEAGKVDPNDRTKGDNITKEIESQEKPSKLSPDQQPEKEKKGKDGSNMKDIVIRFQKLCETHGTLTFQIRSSLKALGGGGRSAKALEEMHDALTRIAKSFDIVNQATPSWNPSECVQALNDSHDAAKDTLSSFKELEVFNMNFFDKLSMMKDRLETVAKKLNFETGCLNKSQTPLHLTGYLHSFMWELWEPLASDFEGFIPELTAIAEKEIAAIRQTQEFLSQRYLVLTTVATFLSSVTVTTLQITTGDTVYPLVNIMNTLWLISIVFSTSSAVYSLLIMTWRQSPVRQPDQSLPSWAHTWLRNGPMYALVIAVMTFSVGICVLAFQLADKQGHLPLAAVPTVFAGVHASSLLLISTWLLFEQWKDRLKHASEKIRGYHSQATDKLAEFTTFSKVIMLLFAPLWGPILVTVLLINFVIRQLHKTQFLNKIRDYGSREKSRPIQLYTARMRGEYDHSYDLEEGEDATIDSRPTSEASEHIRIVADDSSETGQTSEDSGSDVPEDAVILPENDSESNEPINDMQETSKAENNHGFRKLLEFSPRGSLLASAVSDTVTVYNVQLGFNIWDVYKVPGGDQVIQITWSQNNDLLVHSTRRVTVWKQLVSWSRHDHSSVSFDEIIRSVQWDERDKRDHKSRFACVISNSIRFFNVDCKLIDSYNLSGALAHVHLHDMAFWDYRHILCLVSVPKGEDEMAGGPKTRLKFVDVFSDLFERFGDHFERSGGPLESECEVASGHTSLDLSQNSQQVLLCGSQHGAQVAELSISDSLGLVVTRMHRLDAKVPFYGVLSKPVKTFGWYWFRDGIDIIACYSESEIMLLINPGGRETSFRHFHTFTTRNAKAICRSTVSPAIKPASEPFMFAFSDADGSVKIWSVWANRDLANLDSAEDFKVDGEYAQQQGRFLTLPALVAS